MLMASLLRWAGMADDDDNAYCRECGKSINVKNTRNGDNLCKGCDMFG